MFILTESGRLIDDSARPFKEFVNGSWGDLKSSLMGWELLSDNSRVLSEEEVARLVKSGKFN